jgi:hypothetical protein
MPPNWQDLGGEVNVTATFGTRLAAVSPGPNNLHLFAVEDHAPYRLLHKRWTGQWLPSVTEWDNLGSLTAAIGSIPSYARSPVALYSGGNIDVFVLSVAGTLPLHAPHERVHRQLG